MPEELEKHLILNSNCLRTFEDARLEVVTYVEAKFALRIRDSKPSDTGKEKGHRVRVMGVFLMRWSTFSTTLQCTQKRMQANVWQRQTDQVMVQE